MPPPDAQIPVTVLGAGIVGICTALSLLERGVPVRIIDRDAPGQATSFGNAGVVSPWSVIPQSTPGIWKSIPKLMFGHGRPLAVRLGAWPRMIPWGLRFLRFGSEERMRSVSDAMAHLCGPSIDIYRKHLDGTGHEDLLRDSMYLHAFRDASRANLNDLEYRIRAEKGAEMELVGRDRLAELEPALSPDLKAAVVLKGQARVRSPGRLGEVLADKARRLGAEIVQAEVKAIKPNGTSWDIHCQGEVLQGSRIVVTMGTWSRDLLKPIGLDVPLMTERGYHVEFADPGIELNNSIMDVDGKVVASSMEGGVRVAGLAEFAPIDAPQDPRRKAQLTGLAQATFQGLNTEQTSFWMGRRPSFPDSLPMLGAVPGHDGLYLNFGHSHYGLMMAPKSGEVAAGQICGERSNFDLDAFAADRFDRIH